MRKKLIIAAKNAILYYIEMQLRVQDEVRNLTPDEVCEALTSIGANVSRRTLLNYEEDGLIPVPQRGGGGRGGRYTDYPSETVEEAFAAWSLIHGKYGDVINNPFQEATPRMSPAAIKELRTLHYSGRREDVKDYVATEETYLAISNQILIDISKYGVQSHTHADEFVQQEIQEYLCDASMRSVEGMRKIKWGFLVLWKAECLRARALLVLKRRLS